VNKERINKMKSAFAHISLFAVQTQRYIPVVVMVFAMVAMVITMCPPENGGGTGL
jgi:hypothetical protein